MRRTLQFLVVVLAATNVFAQYAGGSRNPAAHGIVGPNSRTQIFSGDRYPIRYSDSPIRDSAVRFIAAISLTAHICPMTLTISDMVLIILLLQ